MNNTVQISITPTPEQNARLRALQLAFSEVCNALAPIVRETRCWNRVALHHMAYRSMRERFPQLGSQMVCNAIYSVSRACRAVYQSPSSPFNLSALGERPLPLIRFAPTSPVYFDRHTLSIKAGHLSMYTLDGRMRFELALSAEDERRFHEGKLAEIVLSSGRSLFTLTFVFGTAGDNVARGGSQRARAVELPEHVRVLPDAEPAATGVPA